jgi:hypothetical protein
VIWDFLKAHMPSFKVAAAPQHEHFSAARTTDARMRQRSQVILLAIAVILGAGWAIGLYFALAQMANVMATAITG